MADENRDKGKTTWLKAAKSDVVTAASGLQYKVLKKGEAESPKVTDTVEVHYIVL